ncbi:MAG: hypothetical protein ACLP9Y_27475, partial [Mycobacterium sp.]
LVLAASTADRDDKNYGNELVGTALEPSGAAARNGTSLHKESEHVDRGGKPRRLPAPFDNDIPAYQKTINDFGIVWTAIETFRVFDEWRVAGTADRIGWYRGRLTVADLKCGSIDYPGKFALQLAVYAHSVPYNTETDTRGEREEDLDLTRGLIIHLPAGQGRCDLYEINLEKGWEACQLAHQVWQWRDTRGLLKPVTPTFTDRARGAADLDELRAIWKEARRGKAHTQDFLNAVEERRQILTVKN